MPAGGEHSGAGHVQILRAVHPAVGIDDAVARKDISGIAARLLRTAVDHTPIEELLDALSSLG